MDCPADDKYIDKLGDLDDTEFREIIEGGGYVVANNNTPEELVRKQSLIGEKITKIESMTEPDPDTEPPSTGGLMSAPPGPIPEPESNTQTYAETDVMPQAAEAVTKTEEKNYKEMIEILRKIEQELLKKKNEQDNAELSDKMTRMMEKLEEEQYRITHMETLTNEILKLTGELQSMKKEYEQRKKDCNETKAASDQIIKETSITHTHTRECKQSWRVCKQFPGCS